jgi:hypothetical protein
VKCGAGRPRGALILGPDVSRTHRHGRSIRPPRGESRRGGRVSHHARALRHAPAHDTTGSVAASHRFRRGGRRGRGRPRPAGLPVRRLTPPGPPGDDRSGQRGAGRRGVGGRPRRARHALGARPVRHGRPHRRRHRHDRARRSAASVSEPARGHPGRRRAAAQQRLLPGGHVLRGGPGCAARPADVRRHRAGPPRGDPRHRPRRRAALAVPRRVHRQVTRHRLAIRFVARTGEPILSAISVTPTSHV